MELFTNQDNNTGTITFDGSKFSLSKPTTFDDILNVTDGTAAAPSLVSASGNSGIYFGSGYIGFSTAASERVTIDGGGDINISSGGLYIGTSGTPITLVSGEPELTVYSTSALTSGTQDIVKIAFTQTAAQQTGYIKGIRCTMTSDVKTPGSFNAIKGIIDYSTSGYAWGDCAPLASELTMANSVVTHGTYAAIEAQIAIGAASDWSSAGPCSFLRLKTNGTTATWDTFGYLINLEGIAATAGGMFDSTANLTNAQIDHTLRILINSVAFYIPLMDNANGS